MKKYLVTWKVELNSRSLGAVDDGEIQELVEYIKSGQAVEPFTAKNVKEKDGIIRFDVETTTEAESPDEAIAETKASMDLKSTVSCGGPIPIDIDISSFKAQEI